MMKIKSGFRVRHVADSYLAVPIGERTQDVSGVIALSETGAFLWRLLENGSDEAGMRAALLDEYDVSEELAEKDVSAFVASLRKAGWLDENV